MCILILLFLACCPFLPPSIMPFLTQSKQNKRTKGWISWGSAKLFYFIYYDPSVN